MELAHTAPREIVPLPRALKAGLGLLLTVGSLVLGYRTTLTPVTLVLNEESRQLRTQQDTVAALLADIDLELHPKDTVSPPLGTTIRSGMTIRIQQARLVDVCVDQQCTTLRTQASSLDDILDEAQVTLHSHDEVTIEGELRPQSQGEPPRIVVERAIPFLLNEGDETTTIYTTAPTVGEALHRAGLTLHLADHVRPDLSTRIAPDMEIVLERSTPVTVQVDGRSVRTRTHRDVVGDVLADLGIVLTGQDYAKPPLDAELRGETSIDVVRVTERFVIEQEPIPFESIWQADPNLEIDHRQLLQEGSPGVFERRYRVRYENGHEISRTLENEYTAVSATTKIRGYGTKIVVRTLDTPSGPVDYWRKIRMLATSYSASTAGVARTNPHYGRTATGLTMRKGIVAVDPHVIDLGSEVYVPGYGVGLAADTGGAIKGKRIDLGYSDSGLRLWYQWVDVYLLTPVPPAHQIDYDVP